MRNISKSEKIKYKVIFQKKKNPLIKNKRQTSTWAPTESYRKSIRDYIINNFILTDLLKQVVNKFHGRLKRNYDLNSPLSKEIDCVNKNLLTKIPTGPKGFTSIFYQNIYKILHKFFLKTENKISQLFMWLGFIWQQNQNITV